MCASIWWRFRRALATAVTHLSGAALRPQGLQRVRRVPHIDPPGFSWSADRVILIAALTLYSLSLFSLYVFLFYYLSCMFMQLSLLSLSLTYI